jgi:dipeptidyl aminopeptidase/acylaminoacyl peptidase
MSHNPSASIKSQFPLADDAEIQALVDLDLGGKPVEDFFQNPARNDYKISPDGKYLSWLAPYQERMNLFVRFIETGEDQRLTSRTDRDIPGYFWADAERLIYVQDNGGDENYHVYTIKRDGTGERDLTPFDGVKAEIIDDLKDIDGQIIVGLNKNNEALFEPYRLYLDSGELVQLAENTDMANPISGWLTDHEGRIRVATRMKDGVNQSLLYRETENDAFEVLQTVDFKDGLSPLFFTFDNKQLYLSSNLGRDTSAIVRYNPATKQEEEVIFSNDEYDVSNLHYSHKRKVLTGVTYTSWKRQILFMDAEAERIYKHLFELLPGYEVVLTSHDRAEELFVVRTYSDRSLGSYYFYNAITGKLDKLAEVSPKLNEAEMAEMKPITYTSRDGLTIHGYLTIPQGSAGKNLPVVVNPHGGPWHRDGWGFNPEVQLLANRGYAVFQMNFRGSTGYGRAFWQSSFKQWGQTMQNDITDGVNWLIDQGIADPARIAIYGGSYGGYATLAGVTYTPDLYRCAIDYVGVSNLFSFLETIPPYWKPYLDMMYEMVGHPERDKAMMHASSPVFHVNKIKAPLFIVQGAKDPRVNIDESDQIVKALRAHGVQVPYLVKANEGHGFRNQENKFEFYKAMCGFLRKHLS